MTTRSHRSYRRTREKAKVRHRQAIRTKVKAIKAEAKEGRANTVVVARATWDRWEQHPTPQHLRTRLPRKLGHSAPQMGPPAANL